MRFQAATAALLCAVTTGCLTNTYRIPRHELARLSSLPPEARGQQVRIVQELATSSAPPDAQPVGADASVHIIVAPNVGVGHRGSARGGDLAKGKKDDAWVWVVIAATAAFALAATEGARYDGWAQVHPMHPVHLFGPGGYRVVPLAQLAPNEAMWATRAVLRDTEGPWRPLGRAPLDREGFTYSFLGGIGTLPSADGTEERGPAFHIQFGYFPQQSVGIVGDVGFGWRQNDLDETLFDVRNSLELQFLPLSVARLHGGVFGNVGVGSRFEDGYREKRQGLTAAAGAMLQLELTTRCALAARFAMGSAYDETTQDVTVGVSIY